MKKFTLYIGLMLVSLGAQSLEDVLKSDHRSDKNKARDVYRNPLETLNFFGIKNNMTVVFLNRFQLSLYCRRVALDSSLIILFGVVWSQSGGSTSPDLVLFL